MSSSGATKRYLQILNEQVEFLEQSRSRIMKLLDESPAIVNAELLGKLNELSNKIDKFKNDISEFKEKYNLS
jgi:predicted translin family RNA/ssDNA-binding protein